MDHADLIKNIWLILISIEFLLQQTDSNKFESIHNVGKMKREEKKPDDQENPANTEAIYDYEFDYEDYTEDMKNSKYTYNKDGKYVYNDQSINEDMLGDDYSRTTMYKNRNYNKNRKYANEDIFGDDYYESMMYKDRNYKKKGKYANEDMFGDDYSEPMMYKNRNYKKNGKYDYEDMFGDDYYEAMMYKNRNYKKNRKYANEDMFGDDYYEPMMYRNHNYKKKGKYVNKDQQVNEEMLYDDYSEPTINRKGIYKTSKKPEFVDEVKDNYENEEITPIYSGHKKKGKTNKYKPNAKLMKGKSEKVKSKPKVKEITTKNSGQKKKGKHKKNKNKINKKSKSKDKLIKVNPMKMENPQKNNNEEMTITNSGHKGKGTPKKTNNKDEDEKITIFNSAYTKIEKQEKNKSKVKSKSKPEDDGEETIIIKSDDEIKGKPEKEMKMIEKLMKNGKPNESRSKNEDKEIIINYTENEISKDVDKLMKKAKDEPEGKNNDEENQNSDLEKKVKQQNDKMKIINSIFKEKEKAKDNSNSNDEPTEIIFNNMEKDRHVEISPFERKNGVEINICNMKMENDMDETATMQINISENGNNNDNGIKMNKKVENEKYSYEIHEEPLTFKNARKILKYLKSLRYQPNKKNNCPLKGKQNLYRSSILKNRSYKKNYMDKTATMRISSINIIDNKNDNDIGSEINKKVENKKDSYEMLEEPLILKNSRKIEKYLKSLGCHPNKKKNCP